MRFYVRLFLNLTNANYVDSDPKKPQRQLKGFSISAKRYTLHLRKRNQITIIDPKAHGLGYLYPPADSPRGWHDEHEAPKWVYEAWEWILRKMLGLKPLTLPWIKRPQMMRMAVTTHNVLERLHLWKDFRPYNFFLLPILAVGGCPRNVDPDNFTPAARFESDQSKWMYSRCINIGDPNDRKHYQLTTDFASSEYGNCAVIDTFENLLHRYIKHPEAKSLGPDGKPCGPDTRGLLQRVHVVAGNHRRIGKECDRRLEEGDDLESLAHEVMEYPRGKAPTVRADMTIARKGLIRKIRNIGFPKLIRAGCSRQVLRKICRRQLLGASTLNEYERVVMEHARKRIVGS